MDNLYRATEIHRENITAIFKESAIQTPIIKTVIDGKLDGQLYIDNEENPKNSMISTHFGWYCILGEKIEDDFIRKCLEHISNETINTDEQFVIFGVKEECHTLIDEYFGSNMKNIPRVTYVYDTQTNIELKPSVLLPEGYKIQRIDDRLIKNAMELFDGIEMFWSNEDNFLKNGIGYCVIYEGEVVSICQAAAITDEYWEIDVFTHDDHRGKNLAYHACMSFMEECIKNGRKPFWETVIFNKSSCKLAEKLGFKEQRKYPFFAWFG